MQARQREEEKKSEMFNAMQEQFKLKEELRAEEQRRAKEELRKIEEYQRSLDKKDRRQKE